MTKRALLLACLSFVLFFEAYQSSEGNANPYQSSQAQAEKLGGKKLIRKNNQKVEKLNKS